MAASSGAERLHAARTARRDPSRDGLGGHSLLPVLPSLPTLRLLGGVGVLPPDVTPAALRLRKGTRFTYECGLNIPWLHEVRIKESCLAAAPGKTYPICIAGAGACPPEDCGGPRGYLDGLDNAASWDAFDDLHTMADILRKVVLEDRPEVLKDQETWWRLEDAVECSKARERARGSRHTTGRIARLVP